MTIDQVLGESTDDFEPAAAWTNLFGFSYGGYVAGVLIRAFERELAPGTEVSGVHVGFARPVRADTPTRVRVDTHHSGRSGQSMSGQITQGGSVTTTGIAWATAIPDEAVVRDDLGATDAGRAGDYEAASITGGADGYVDRELEVRPVPTQPGEARLRQWMRLKQLDLGPDGRWPVSALALVADMVGGGQYLATQLALGDDHASLSLDLTMHVLDRPRGDWVLGDFQNVYLGHGRTTGRGFLYAEDGTPAGMISQHSLVRRMG